MCFLEEWKICKYKLKYQYSGTKWLDTLILFMAMLWGISPIFSGVCGDFKQVRSKEQEII